MNEEHKRKIGLGNKGKTISYEQRKKISEGVKKSLTPEVRLKMSMAAKKRSVNGTFFKKGHTINLGRVRTQEVRNNMSKGRKGMKFSKEHIKNLSISLKGRKSPMKGTKMSDETKNRLSKSLKGRCSPRKGVKLSDEIKKKISISKKGKNIGHKSYLPKGYKHSDEVKRKISEAARLNWTKESFRKKCFGKNQFKKSYMERNLFNLIKKVFPSVKDDFVITTNKWVRFPDCYIPEKNIVVEYDGKKWHKLENDKKRDLEILSLGYKILHYQGYIPSVNELLKDIDDLKDMNYKYKRDFVDITTQINNIIKYDELRVNDYGF